MHIENMIYYFSTVKLPIWNVWAFFKTMFRLEISFYLDVTADWTAETQTSVLQNSKKYEPYLNKSVKKGKIRFIDSKLKYKIQRIRKKKINWYHVKFRQHKYSLHQFDKFKICKFQFTLHEHNLHVLLGTVNQLINRCICMCESKGF